jgi:uncharacterized protein RhaS with RHS repeats
MDPLSFDAGDVNLYRYVHNGPTGATDSSGTEPPVDRLPNGTAPLLRGVRDMLNRTPRRQSNSAWSPSWDEARPAIVQGRKVEHPLIEVRRTRSGKFFVKGYGDEEFASIELKPEGVK